MNCHAGSIDVVFLDGSTIITGGGDGYVRTWPLGTITEAEPTDTMPIFEIEPLAAAPRIPHGFGSWSRS